LTSATKRQRQTKARESRARQRVRGQRQARLRRLATIAAVIVVGAVVGTWLISGASGGVAYAGDIRPGGSLERLELPALEGDGLVDYANLADEPLVINFFASWCPSCIAEMPAFEQVHQKLGDRVGFLGISQSDAASASIDLAHQTGITYQTAIDPNGVFFNAAGGRGMPTTILVRPGGEIAEVWVGGLDAASLERLIAEELGVSA